MHRNIKPTVPTALCDWLASPLGHAVWGHITAQIRQLHGTTTPLTTPLDIALIGPNPHLQHIAAHLWPQALTTYHVGQTCRFDRILVAHALEHADPSPLIATSAQVIRPDGTLIIVVPHRTSLWSIRSHFSPFGAGTPYTLTQLTDTLTQHQLKVTGHRYALYAPPFSCCWKQTKLAKILRHLCQKLFKKQATFTAGVLIVTAQKDQPALTPLKTTPAKKLKTKTNPIPLPTSYKPTA